MMLENNRLRVLLELGTGAGTLLLGDSLLQLMEMSLLGPSWRVRVFLVCLSALLFFVIGTAIQWTLSRQNKQADEATQFCRTAMLESPPNRV